MMHNNEDQFLGQQLRFECTGTQQLVLTAELKRAAPHDTLLSPAREICLLFHGHEPNAYK